MSQIRQTKSSELPLFAQPVEYSNGNSVRSGKSPVYRIAALIGFCGAVGASLLLPKANHAQNLPAPLTENHSGPTVDPATTPGANHRRSLDFYVHGVRGSLFSPPVPPAPKVAAIRPIKSVQIVKVAPPKPIAVPVVEINPFADWAYKGTVHLGDDTMVLLENTKTNEGQYLRVGDMFIGAQVSAITDQQVSLVASGKPTLLAKSDAMNVLPLDKSADFLKGGQQNPGGPQNGNPGGPPPGAPAGGPPQDGKMGAGPMVTLPNGRTMSAGRAARRAQWMNNNFNK